MQTCIHVTRETVLRKYELLHIFLTESASTRTVENEMVYEVAMEFENNIKKNDSFKEKLKNSTR
ncbi:hypothetical protein [Halarcobacter ebronensis]|uniref:hypothetical protein n=1 Tax=Halarcobacter ebronensis TaxID=1462615 RepID=UPI003C78FA5A